MDLTNDTKFLSKIGLVDISICEVTNWLFMNEFNDIWVFKYSSSISLPLKSILVSIVFALILKFNGSKVSLIFFKLVSNLSFFCLTRFWIWLLNLSVSKPTVLK